MFNSEKCSKVRMSSPNNIHRRNELNDDIMRSTTFLVVTNRGQHNQVHSRGDQSSRSTNLQLMERRPKNDVRGQLMTHKQHQQQQQRFDMHHQPCHLSQSSKATSRSREIVVVDNNGNQLSGLALERALHRSRRAIKSPSSDIARDLDEHNSSEEGATTNGKRTVGANQVDTAVSVLDCVPTARPNSAWKSRTRRQPRYTFSDKRELKSDEDSIFEVNLRQSCDDTDDDEAPEVSVNKSHCRRQSEPVNRCTAVVNGYPIEGRQPHRPFSLPGRRISTMETKKRADGQPLRQNISKTLKGTNEEEDFDSEDDEESSFERNGRKGRRHTVAEVQRDIKSNVLVQSKRTAGNAWCSEAVLEEQVDCCAKKADENSNANHDILRAARRRILSRLSKTCEPETVATLTDHAKVEPTLLKSKRRHPRKLESLFNDSTSTVAEDVVNLPTVSDSPSNNHYRSTSFGGVTSVLSRPPLASKTQSRLPSVGQLK